MLGQAIEGTGSLDQKKVCEYMHATSFETVVGDVKFGPNGEWETSRVLLVQLQNIQGNEVEEFTKPGKMVVLYPPEFKSGDLIYPFPGFQ